MAHAASWHRMELQSGLRFANRTKSLIETAGFGIAVRVRVLSSSSLIPTVILAIDCPSNKRTQKPTKRQTLVWFLINFITWSLLRIECTSNRQSATKSEIPFWALPGRSVHGTPCRVCLRPKQKPEIVKLQQSKRRWFSSPNSG